MYGLGILESVGAALFNVMWLWLDGLVERFVKPTLTNVDGYVAIFAFSFDALYFMLFLFTDSAYAVHFLHFSASKNVNRLVRYNEFFLCCRF